MTTPDAVLTRAAANCAEAYRRFAEAIGKPWRIDEDMVLADVGLPADLPTNSATMLRPLPEGDAGFVADRLGGFFDESPGGGFQLWSMWPTPDLSPWGFHPWGVPCMVREASGDRPPAPDELHIEEALDAAAVARASSLLGDAFGVPAEAQPFMDPAFNTDDARIWLGTVDGRPVSTAAAVVAGGFCGVYAVATSPDARGHGYGEALSWAATGFRADLPATLQASDMGRPVYERMGYEIVTTCHCWSRERRPG